MKPGRPSALEQAQARRASLFAVAEAFQKNLPGAQRPYPLGVLADPSTWFTERELEMRRALEPHWNTLEQALNAACQEAWRLTPLAETRKQLTHATRASIHRE